MKREIVLGELTLDLNGFKVFLCDVFSAAENEVRISSGRSQIIANFEDVIGGSCNDVFWFAVREGSKPYMMAPGAFTPYDLSINRIRILKVDHSGYGSMYSAKEMVLYISHVLQDKIHYLPNPCLHPAHGSWH